MKVRKDADARVMALQNGEVDFSAESLQAQDIELLEANNNISFMETKGSRGFHLMFNYENKVLQDKNIRLALNYAVDKDEIANDLLDGNGIAAKGMFNASVVPYVTDENSPGYAYDPNKARELLKEAGYEDTNGDGYVDKNGQNLSFKLLLQNTEYPDFKPVCEFLKEQYKEVGIQIDLNLMEQNAYYDEIWTGKNYDLVIYRTYADAWNPHGFLMDMYTSKDGTLPAAWNDETLQSMIDNTMIYLRIYKSKQSVFLYIIKKAHLDIIKN